jgi:hypothetical protein
MRKYIWVTWERQRRNIELSKALSCEFFELSEIDRIKNRLLKYGVGIKKTVSIIAKRKPNLVCCQNPSIMLAFLMVALKPLFNFGLVVDAHNAGLFPLNGRYTWLNWVAIFIQKHSDLTLVTNEKLKISVEKNGGWAYILPDKIPSIPKVPIKKLKGKVNVLYICTFADDEPYDEVFNAALHINPDVVIYITGNYKKREINHRDLPSNLELMGFISEYEFFQMLNSVDIIIDLTTRADCLVCGAYESVAVSKPVVLSNTASLKAYFTSGTVFTENRAESIALAIKKAISQKEQLSEDLTRFKKTCEKSWEKKKLDLARILKIIAYGDKSKALS